MHSDADELKLRTARPGDAGALAALQTTTWRDALAGVLPPAALASLNARALTREWKATIERDLVLVAGLGTDVVACCAVGRGAPDDPFFRSEIKAIAVTPGQHRRGIGSGLLFEALEHIDLPALAWVLEDNAAGRAFIEACGGLPVRRDNRLVAGVVMAHVGYALFDP